MDLWRPGSDREPAGSVYWNGPGNKDFGVIGPGTAALGHTGPAATASIKAGMAHPDGSFPERSFFSPRVLRLGGCFRLPVKLDSSYSWSHLTRERSYHSLSLVSISNSMIIA